VAWGKFKVRYRPKVVVLLLAGASSVNSFKNTETSVKRRKGK
jgi:hypothetical protein